MRFRGGGVGHLATYRFNSRLLLEEHTRQRRPRRTDRDAPGHTLDHRDDSDSEGDQQVSGAPPLDAPIDPIDSSDEETPGEADWTIDQEPDSDNDNNIVEDNANDSDSEGEIGAEETDAKIFADEGFRAF